MKMDFTLLLKDTHASPSKPIKQDTHPKEATRSDAPALEAASCEESPTAWEPSEIEAERAGKPLTPRGTQHTAAPAASETTRLDGESYKTYRKRMARLRLFERNGRLASSKTRAKVLGSSVQRSTELRAAELPASRDGYSSKNVHKASQESRREWGVEELIAEGFSLIKWNG